MSRLIDADALIHELNNSHYPGAPYVDAGISIAIGKVCDAPTIEPERKPGHWIDNHTTCSECGWQMIDDVMQTPNMVGFNYCPNCGADMREGEQDGQT